MTKHHGSLPAKRSGTFTPFFNEVRKGVYTDQTERFLLEDNGQLEYIITDLRLNQKVGRARGLSYARDRVKTYLQNRNERLEPPPSLPPNRPAIVEDRPSEPQPFNPPRLVITEDHKAEVVEPVEFIADLYPVEELPPLPAILRDSVPGLLKVIEVCKSDTTFQVTAAEIAIITEEKLGVAVRRLEWLLKSGYLTVVENKKRGGCIYKWERPVDELIERVSKLHFGPPAPHKPEEDTPEKVIAAMTPQTQPPAESLGDDTAVMVGRAFVKIAALEEKFGNESANMANEMMVLIAKVSRLQDEVGRISEWLQKVFQAPWEVMTMAAEEERVTANEESKKARIIELWEEGQHDLGEIVRRVKARPSYVAQVLQQAGHLTEYFDLYTSTGAERNPYTRFFRNVLSFRNVEAARESVERIDRLYNYFERLGDRSGQHQAMILALTGKNRARWSGKIEESQVFSDWLVAH